MTRGSNLSIVLSISRIVGRAILYSIPLHHTYHTIPSKQTKKRTYREYTVVRLGEQGEEWKVQWVFVKVTRGKSIVNSSWFVDGSEEGMLWNPFFLNVPVRAVVAGNTAGVFHVV